MSEQSNMGKAIALQSYNHRSGTKSFLQRQIELTKLHDCLMDRVELFSETHVSSTGKFISPAVENGFVSLRKLYVLLYFQFCF